MKLNMQSLRTRLLFTITLFLTVVSSTSCGDSSPVSETALSDAYRELYDAVKSGESELIKGAITKETLLFADFIAKQQQKSLDDVLRNGFTRTTFSPELPDTRDQQVKDGVGHLEVFNSVDNKWEVLPFILEDGKWKAAFGEMFNGKWASPTKPRSQIEMERKGGTDLIPGPGLPQGQIPGGFKIDPSVEQEVMKQTNPTLGPSATPSPNPNNPTLK